MRFTFLHRPLYQQLMVATLLGISCLVLPFSWLTRGLLAWGLGCFWLLGHFWSLAFHLNAAQTQERIVSLDPSPRIIFMGLSLAWLFSVASIASLLYNASTEDALQRFGHLMLCLFGLVESWLLIHTVFAFRYAHIFYLARDRKDLLFPGNENPDYMDFLYFSCGIGMCAQVSDIAVATSGIRRLVMGQSLLSFAFNMVILALAINVASGLMH
jgi:uncharacterized membrane protein